MHLVARVAPKVTADLCNRKDHLLLVHPGLIARYDQMTVLETLAGQGGARRAVSRTSGFWWRRTGSTTCPCSTTPRSR